MNWNWKSVLLMLSVTSIVSGSFLGGATFFALAQSSQVPATQWSQTYNALSGASLIETGDLGYLVLGSAAIYSDNQAGALLKVDSSGNQMWLRNVDSFGQNMYLAKATNGDFAVATTTARTLAYQDSTYNVNEFYLSKFDSNGNKLWNRTYVDDLRSISLASIASTADGGFILGGYAHYYDPASYTASREDIVVLKTDANGNSVWNKTYGGADDDILNAIDRTSDGGYVIAAYSRSFKDSQTIWLIKTDSDGAIQWNTFYTSSNLNLQPSSLYANGVLSTKDKGYLIFGSLSLYQSSTYQSSGLLFKTDENGNLQWTQTYPDGVNYAIQTQDGGYALSTPGSGGTTVITRTDGSGALQWNTTYPAATERYDKSMIQAQNGSLVLTGKSSNKLWLLKTAPLQTVPPTQLPNPKPLPSANASLIWQHYFDGLDSYSVISTLDGGFALAGKTAIPQSNALGSEYINYSTILIKTDGLGNLVFRRDLPIGNMFTQDNSSFQTIISSVDIVMSFIVQTADGGFALAGTTTLHRNSGNYDNYCMAKTDSQGNLLWVQQYDFRDSLSAFAQTPDGGYVLAGSAGYVPSRVTHIVKTDASGKVQWSTDLSLNIVAEVISTADDGYTVVGSTYAYSSGTYSGSFKITHLSSSGNVTWTNSLSGISPQTGTLTKDGGYLFAGLSNPQTYLSSSVLLKLDNLGNISWYKLYDTQPFYYPKSLISLQNGGFLLAATTPDYRCFVKVDENGDVERVITLDALWTSYSDNSLNAIQTTDGNYVFTGKYIGLNTTEYDRVWLAKINQQFTPLPSKSPSPNPSPTIPEFPTWIILLFVVGSLVYVRTRKKEGKL